MRLNPARSLLFVPLTAPRFFEKAATRGADALILDLEDAVRPERKDDARAMVPTALEVIGAAVAAATTDPRVRAPRILVRVNAEPELLSADIASLPLARIDGLMLPKVEHADQVTALVDAVTDQGHRRCPPLAALIETPRGLLQAGSIAAHPALAALGFGAEDYAAAMAIDPEPETLGWAAHQVTNAARAYGLECWGLPGSVAGIDDMAGFGDLVRQARRIGFTGTVCVHPRQVAMANDGFGPSAEQIAWARIVVEADRSARAAGLGAVMLNGRMIDRPIIERAKRWLQQDAERSGTTG